MLIEGQSINFAKNIVNHIDIIKRRKLHGHLGSE